MFLLYEAFMKSERIKHEDTEKIGKLIQSFVRDFTKAFDWQLIGKTNNLEKTHCLLHHVQDLKQQGSLENTNTNWLEFMHIEIGKRGGAQKQPDTYTEQLAKRNYKCDTIEREVYDLPPKDLQLHLKETED